MAREIDKLGDQQIRRWIKAAVPLAKADGGGLTFTLSAAGTAAWVLRYRHGGKGRELTLGRYPDVSLKLARQRSGDARAEIQNGADVARERQPEKAESAAAKSFRQLGTDYMTKVFPTLAPSTVKQRRQHIEGVIFPKLGSRAARDLTTSDVVSFIEAVGRSKTSSVVDLVFTALSEIFKHGLARHAVSSPGESHPQALSEPYVRLSPHTAPSVQSSRPLDDLALVQGSSPERLAG